MKHYLFDFDGTLVDSMPTYVGVMLRILKETNTPYGEVILIFFVSLPEMVNVSMTLLSFIMFIVGLSVFAYAMRRK